LIHDKQTKSIQDSTCSHRLTVEAFVVADLDTLLTALYVN
jgi:hypothetical protein